MDSWKEEESKAVDNNIIEIKDVFAGEEVVEETLDEKYLGDIISHDGRNSKNIKARINKGRGIVKKILNILNCIPFGKLYFQIAVILRNSLLVSSLLCNSEAWFNLTKADLNLIESVDLELLRKILNAPLTTPKEALFLELGVMPLRDIIRQRRIIFLHYIIKQKSESMIGRIFETQNRKRTPKDWITTVLKDLEELNLDFTFTDIKHISKENWKKLVKRNVIEKTFKNLLETKQTHSKVMKLEYEKLEMQTYFLPNKFECSKEDVQLIFKIRSNMTNAKMNKKNLHKTHECTICLKENETQQHVYICNEIFKISGRKNENNPMYEKIINGNRKEKIEIAKIFKENMKIIEMHKQGKNQD